MLSEQDESDTERLSTTQSSVDGGQGSQQGEQQFSFPNRPTFPFLY